MARQSREGPGDGWRARAGVPPSTQAVLPAGAGRPAVPAGSSEPDLTTSAMPHSDPDSPLRARRPHLFKCRLSDDEHRVVLARSRGYPSPAEYGRRRLVAGWALPIHRLATVTEAFLPIQRAIDLAAASGHPAAADEATEALRRILAAVAEP